MEQSNTRQPAGEQYDVSAPQPHGIKTSGCCKNIQNVRIDVVTVPQIQPRIRQQQQMDRKDRQKCDQTDDPAAQNGMILFLFPRQKGCQRAEKNPRKQKKQRIKGQGGEQQKRRRRGPYGNVQ